ncbi:MAG TPA: M56 family metallopeptidase [Thermoanaerobaculia bacterium]|nr:M56 family metallopeptidase [Thermoanaerobaculia bacterium]
MFENLMNQMMDQVLAWLLTYSLHSTLFLCLALLASKRLAGRRARLEEAMWRFALVAALVTATVQLAAGWEPVAGRWTLNAPPAASAMEVASRSASSGAIPARALPVSLAARAESPQASLPLWPFDLRSTVLGLWACGALFLCLRWTGSYLRLKRRLRARPEVVGGGMFTLMRQLSGDLGLAPLVRLTCSSRVSVPVALGLGRPEICVPPRAISHLEPEQQEGMLAHELAHLVRRDPFWLAFSRILAGALFFQPLNWVACRRLRELSERLCDEWAVERTGRPLSLARCLAEVAGWSVRSVSSLPVPSMADRPSSLAKRIRHLLDDSRSPERRVRPVWIGAGMLVLLAAVAAVAPGVYAAVAIEEPREAVLAADAADAVEPVEPVEPEDPIEPEYDVIEDEIEARIEGELAGMEAELEGLDDSLEAALAPLEELDGFVGDFDFDFDGMAFLSGEEAEEIGRMAEEISEKYAEEYAALAESMMADMGPELERISEEVNRKLAPEIERISEQVNRELMPEIERISERVANEMEPELERLRAEADRLRRQGGLSEEERERIRSQARELSRRSRPTEEELKAIRDSQRKYRDEMRKFMEDHREEMEAMRSEARAHSEAMRDQMRQRMDADPRYRELRERHRRDMEQIRERHREEMREHREKMKQDREKSREKSKEKEKEKEEKQV